MPHKLLVPDRIVRHVCDISHYELAETLGIKAVLCDLDNTLTKWHSEEITEEVGAWLAQLRDTGIGVCIASNTSNFSRLRRIANNLGIQHFPGNAGKPGTRGLRHALKLLEASPSEAAMVGDQLFTDIVAGNRLGLFTVLVNPLSSYEFIGTKIVNRTAEKFVLRGSLKRPG